MSGEITLNGGGQVLISTSGTSGLGTPATGYGSLYFGNDNLLRLIDDTGNSVILSQGPGGTSGTSGTSTGSAGTSGTAGSAGTSGQSGPIGDSGSSGTSGENGTAGTCGSDGTSSTSGSSGTSGLSAPGPRQVGTVGFNTALDVDGTALANANPDIPGSDIEYNLAVGSYSMYEFGQGNVLIGANCTAVGVNSSYELFQINNNTSLGTDSARYGRFVQGLFLGKNTALNFDGNAGTAIGNGAMGAKPNLGATGSNNVAVGVDSLANIGFLSSENTAIGHEALYNLGTTGSPGSTGNNNNTAVGYRSGYNIQTGSNNTIIGCTGGTAGMTGALVLSNGDNSTELVILSSAIQTIASTSTFNTRIPIKIQGTTYYLLLNT